jgi:lysophospholipase L1-like esterase
VGTWACAPYEAGTNTPSKELTGNTLRQIVRVSIGGDTLRVKFSNITCPNAVSIKSVNIAVSPDGTKSAITASTIKELKFNGLANVTMNAKSEVTSDPIAFDLKPSMRLAITIYYDQCKTSSDMTFHYGSRTNSYLLTGDKTTSADFSGATVIERWYTISTIEVLANKTAAAVAVLGNSITDGYGLSGGLQNRWTDVFSEALLKNKATEQVSVLNLGIGATLVTGASNGAKSGVDRFQHDILEQSGVRWVIIFYGVNDVGASKSASDIINGLKNMVVAVRAKDTNIKVYGATITPFMGYNNTNYTRNDQIRIGVNKWIRTAGNFDGVIDFDNAIRNPSDTTRLQAAYSNDWLHPNAAGYKLMGESIDLKMFELPPVNVRNVDDHKGYASGAISSKLYNSTTTITFEIPRESFVSLKVYSILGKEVAELAGKNLSSGKHIIDLTGSNLANGTYTYTLKAGDFSASRKMVFPIR